MLRIGSMVWGATDIPRAVAFWSEALHYELVREPDVDWAMLVPPGGAGADGPQLSLKLVTSTQAQRHHLDLFADDQDDEVERLLALGATRPEWEYEEGADYIVLHDPEGNPFCVVQS